MKMHQNINARTTSRINLQSHDVQYTNTSSVRYAAHGVQHQSRTSEPLIVLQQDLEKINSTFLFSSQGKNISCFPLFMNQKSVTGDTVTKARASCDFDAL